MKSDKNFFRHTVCLCAAFTLGESVLFLPKQSILEMLCGAAAILGLMLVLSLLFKKLNLSKSRILSSLFFFFSLVSGAVCFFDYCIFAKEKMLPEANVFVIALCFFVPVLALFLSKRETLFKFCLISFTSSALLRAAIGIFLLKSVTFKNVLRTTFNFSFGGAFAAAVSFLPAVIALYYISACKFSKKAALFGFSLTASQMISFSLITFGVLGVGAYSRPFSLIDAISTVNAGRIFTRTDAVLYVIFFLSALIKSAVCFKCAFLSFKNLKNSFIIR